MSPSGSHPARRIVLGVCGGIAAYKSAELARRLMDRGFRVQVAMTVHAREFITPLTFAALTGEKVVTDLFATASGDETLQSAIEHIEVARLLSEGLHDVRDAKPLAVPIGVLAAGRQRRDAGPLFFCQLAVPSHALRAKRILVRRGGAVEDIPVGAQLPREETLGECNGIDLRLAAGPMVQLLESFEDPAEVTVGVVGRADGVFDSREGVLCELDDFSGVAILEQLGDRVDDLVDAARVFVHRAIVDEFARIDGVIDGLAEGLHVDAIWSRLGGDH